MAGLLILFTLLLLVPTATPGRFPQAAPACRFLTGVMLVLAFDSLGLSLWMSTFTGSTATLPAAIILGYLMVIHSDIKKALGRQKDDVQKDE